MDKRGFGFMEKIDSKQYILLSYFRIAITLDKKRSNVVWRIVS